MRSIILSGLLFCSLLTSACDRSSDEQIEDEQEVAAPVPVEVATLTLGPLENALRFSANLEAETQVQVLARAPGQVIKVLVEEGDKVELNQVLLRLESAEQFSVLKRTRTELAQGQRRFDKQEKLQKAGVISDDDRELAEFDLKRLRIANSDAIRNLSYTVVRASVAGTVTRRQVKLGDFVNPNQHLFDITDFDTIVAKVFIPEKDIITVKVGQVVRLFSPSDPESGRKAIVQRIAPIVDPRTGTAKVTINIPDTKSLKPGAFVSVEIVTAENSNAVLLPRKALVYDNDEPFAFKLSADKKHVERVRVVPRLEGKSFIEATTGFSVGDRVVIAGQVGLKDKARVAVGDAGKKTESGKGEAGQKSTTAGAGK